MVNITCTERALISLAEKMFVFVLIIYIINIFLIIYTKNVLNYLSRSDLLMNRMLTTLRPLTRTPPAPSEQSTDLSKSGSSIQSEPPKTITGGTSKSSLHRKHRFRLQTFAIPLKCQHCTSLMVGLIRQGYCCHDCKYVCHLHCAENAPPQCPITEDQGLVPIYYIDACPPIVYTRFVYVTSYFNYNLM